MGEEKHVGAGVCQEKKRTNLGGRPAMSPINESGGGKCRPEQAPRLPQKNKPKRLQGEQCPAASARP